MTIRDRPAKQHIVLNQGDYELTVYSYPECYPHVVWFDMVHQPTGLAIKESVLLGDGWVKKGNAMLKRLAQLVKQETST